METITTQPHENFVIDPTGKKIGVILDIGQYHQMLADLEELESIRAYDAAKSADDETVPFENAIAEIESLRR